MAINDEEFLIPSTWAASNARVECGFENFTLSRMEGVAEVITDFLDSEHTGFELFYFLGLLGGTSAEPCMSISVTSTFGEVYFITDFRGQGWVVCRALPSQVTSVRRLESLDDSAKVASSCLQILTGFRQPLSNLEKIH